jgi:hypothetical protein
MRGSSGTVLAVAAVAVALVGLAPAPAMASKLFGARGPAYGDSYRYRPMPPWYRRHACRGRPYAYLGGWGCDYYRYSWDYPRGRR